MHMRSGSGGGASAVHGRVGGNRMNIGVMRRQGKTEIAYDQRAIIKTAGLLIFLARRVEQVLDLLHDVLGDTV